MKQREPVSHIMSKELITVNSTHTLLDVRHIFEERRLHHLPVVSGDKLLGMLSYTDLMRATYGVGEAQEQVNAAIYHTVPIESVMTANPVTVSPDTPIREVAEQFVAHGFHAFPVTEGETLKGIVTTTDVIRYLISLY